MKKAPAKKTPAAKKPVAKKAPAKVAAKKAAPKAAPKTTTTTPVSKIKDTIMATAKKTDFTAQAKEMAADVQTKVKGAYAKATEYASEAGEFNKANLEAVVESGKIFFASAQELAKSDEALQRCLRADFEPLQRRCREDLEGRLSQANKIF